MVVDLYTQIKILFLPLVVLILMCNVNCNSTESNKYNYYNLIVKSSQNYSTNPLLVLSVIRVEQLNNSWNDRIQDRFLQHTIEKRNNNLWWEQWVSEYDSMSSRELMLRSKYNKWSVNLYQSGYVSSYGIGQITPRTLVSACKYYKYLPRLCSCSKRELFQKLLSKEESIDLIAFILMYERDRWIKCNKVPSKTINDAFLLTLYNYGTDLYLLKYDTLISMSRFSNIFLSKQKTFESELKKGEIFLQ